MANNSGTGGGGQGIRTTIPISGKLDDRKNVRSSPRPFEELPEEIQKILNDRKGPARNSHRNTIQMLEGKHVLSLIMYLDKMSPVLKSDVYSDISRTAGMAEKLDDLREMGLIEIYNTVRSNSNVIVITDKGRAVASMIKDIVGLVED